MADKPYRFLLRMPEQLRQKLSASAQREGRSLNSEVVHRLEDSVSEPAATRRARVANPFAGLSRPARLRVGVGFAAVLLLVAFAATAGLFRGDSSKTDSGAAALGPRKEGELPQAIGRKLAQAQRFSVTTIREGGEASSDAA